MPHEIFFGVSELRSGTCMLLYNRGESFFFQVFLQLYNDMCCFSPCSDTLKNLLLSGLIGKYTLYLADILIECMFH